MDRLEIYYGAQSPQQRLGEYVRIRSIYVRSTRSFRFSAAPLERSVSARCRDYPLVHRMRQLRPSNHESTPLEMAVAAATARRASLPGGLPRGVGVGGGAGWVGVVDGVGGGVGAAQETPEGLNRAAAPPPQEGVADAALPDENGGIPSFARSKRGLRGRRASGASRSDRASGAGWARLLALLALVLLVSSVGWLGYRSRYGVPPAVGSARPHAGRMREQQLPFAGSRIE